MDGELWLPLVDEPIGDLVARIQRERPEVALLAASPLRQLAFRTFASVEVGLLLGEILMDEDAMPRARDDPGPWVARLLERSDVGRRVERVVEDVARRVAEDPSLASAPEWPDEEARRRFREFARQSLDGALGPPASGSSRG